VTVWWCPYPHESWNKLGSMPLKPESRTLHARLISPRGKQLNILRAMLLCEVTTGKFWLDYDHGFHIPNKVIAVHD
jgi:hypothetical protein